MITSFTAATYCKQQVDKTIVSLIKSCIDKSLTNVQMMKQYIV